MSQQSHRLTENVYSEHVNTRHNLLNAFFHIFNFGYLLKFKFFLQQAASLEKVLKEQQQQQQLELERAWDQDRDVKGNGSTSPGSEPRVQEHSPPPPQTDTQKTINASVPVSQVSLLPTIDYPSFLTVLLFIVTTFGSPNDVITCVWTSSHAATTSAACFKSIATPNPHETTFPVATATSSGVFCMVFLICAHIIMCHSSRLYFLLFGIGTCYLVLAPSVSRIREETNRTNHAAVTRTATT